MSERQGIVTQCRYDGTYDIKVSDRSGSEEVVTSVGRQDLRLRFEPGDRVRYTMTVVELDAVCDLMMSTEDWVEGVVVSSEAGSDDVFLIGPPIPESESATASASASIGDDASREQRAAESAKAAKDQGIDLVRRRASSNQVWPVVDLAPCVPRPFYKHGIVNVCCVQSQPSSNAKAEANANAKGKGKAKPTPKGKPREVWSFSKQATVVAVVDMPSVAGGAVAVLLDKTTGTISAVDVVYIQQFYGCGRPVYVNTGAGAGAGTPKSAWRHGVVVDMVEGEEPHYTVRIVPETTANGNGNGGGGGDSTLEQKQDDKSSSSRSGGNGNSNGDGERVSIPLANAQQQLRPRVTAPGTLVKVWNGFLGCWQSAEVLGPIFETDSDPKSTTSSASASATKKKGVRNASEPRPYLEVFTSNSRTMVVPPDHVRHVPQEELDAMMYGHAVRLRAVDVSAASPKGTGIGIGTGTSRAIHFRYSQVYTYS